jgi:Na+-transporting NADH:ubiquinone oxidoreductase subunit B
MNDTPGSDTTAGSRWLQPLRRAAAVLLHGGATASRGTVHVRDARSLQRVQAIWLLGLLPAALWGIYNTGLQANLALDPAALAGLEGWRHALLRAWGVGYASDSVWACFVHGALYVLPIYAVTWIVGRAWEWLFAALRGRDLDEGFWVIAMVLPLILPATVPLWQVALAVSWGMVIAKLVFGGTGMNVLHPALVARAFLFYAYPLQILGAQVWVPVGKAVDGFSGATALMLSRRGKLELDGWDGWWQAFVGLQPGSIGETSALLCLLGGLWLVAKGVASWRIMVGVALGTAVAAQLFNLAGSANNPAMALPFWWHMVLGGWAFGAFFLATDPTTSAFTQRGRWIYGLLIGALLVATRVLNPTYPDSTMLVILFMNVFAPLIDHFVVRANLRRRARQRQGHAHR